MSNRKSYTITDFYEEYSSDNDATLDYKTYRALLSKFNTIVAELLLNGVEELKMPFKLGSICIVKYRPKTYTGKSLSVDFKTTAELGKTIYFLNDHSNGYKYRLFWSKKSIGAGGPYFYRAGLTRANNRKLALVIKSKQTDFLEI